MRPGKRLRFDFRKTSGFLILAMLLSMAFSGLQAVLADEYIMIHTAEELAAISDNPEGNYRLANDIDLSEYLSNKKRGWSAIGTTDKPFKGQFDGDGHTISGLWIKTSSAYEGLFTKTSDAQIRDLNIELDQEGITAAYEAGGIVGWADGATLIENCTVTGGSVTVTGGGYAGGIAGISRGPGGGIKNCVVTNFSATTSGNYSGGIAGVAYRTDISGCQAINVKTSGFSYIGGLVGAIHGQSSISQSSASGSTVSGEGSYIGGFCGAMYEQSKITGCYAEFEKITSTLSYAGGFIGTAYEGAVIEKCYATADVTSTTDNYVGGFAGELNNASITNACATGNVQAPKGYAAGGFAGIAYNGSSLTRCNALGDVSGGTGGLGYVGGLLGDLHGNSSLEQCSAYGNVSADGYIAGGLVGESISSSISNCYARGDVAGTTGVGGLVGYFSGTAKSGQTVTNSYSSGKVNGSEKLNELGAFSGRSGVTFTGTNYYDSDKAAGLKPNGSAGSPAGTAPVGHDTETMMKQETFEGWDFDSIWRIDEGETYPYFDFCKFTPEISGVSRKPVINVVYEKDKRVTGTGIPGSEITLTFPDDIVVEGIIVNEEGKWLVAVPETVNLRYNRKLNATQKEPDKTISKEYTETVRKRGLKTSVIKSWRNTNGKSFNIPHDIIQFTVIVKNDTLSTGPWKQVVTVEELHEDLSFVKDSVQIDGEAAEEGTGVNQYQYDRESHTLTVNLGTLDPGKGKNIIFCAQIEDSVPDESEINGIVQVTGNQ